MPVSHCMFSAGRCVFWCPLAGAESDFCGRNGRWKGLIFRHNRVLVQNQGTVLKKSSHRGVYPGHFPSREGENERRPISCAHSSWIKRSTLLCRKMTWVHPVVSFPLIIIIISAHKSDLSYPWSQTQASLSIPSLHPKKTQTKEEKERKKITDEKISPDLIGGEGKK